MCFRRSEYIFTPDEIRPFPRGVYEDPQGRMNERTNMKGHHLPRRYLTFREIRLVKFLEDRDGEATVAETRRALGNDFWGAMADIEESGIADWSQPGGPWRGIGDVHLKETRFLGPHHAGRVVGPESPMSPLWTHL